MLLHGRNASLFKPDMHIKKTLCASYVYIGQPLAGYGEGKTVERPVSSSPHPSSSSSDKSSRRDSIVAFSVHKSDSEDGSPSPPANKNSSSGGGGDDQKEKKDDEEDRDNGDSSSSSDSSSDESDVENDDCRVAMDADEVKDNGIDPTDDDMSGESDGSSDLENAYPRLPPAPVDVLMDYRHQAAHKELQLIDKMKQQVIADARQRYHERLRAHRSKKKTPTLQMNQQHSQSNPVINEMKHRERRRASASTEVTMARHGQRQVEDEWLVDCSCGLKRKNYDDGTSMIQCDICMHWVHAKCADKLPEAVAQEKFVCFRCCWMFDCVCTVRHQPNHDDGQRMVECTSCNTWQHTICVGIPETKEPADDYRCPRCVKKARRRKSDSKGSNSRDRRRRRSCAESQRHSRKRAHSSRAGSVDMRSSARSLDNLESTTRSHRSSNAEVQGSQKKAPAALVVSSPSVLAASPPSTPPPPPSPPPPLRSAKYDVSNGHTKQRSRREKKRLSASTSSSRRKRSHSLGSSLKKTHTEASERERHSSPPDVATSSARGKGLMLRGYSPAAANTGASSSRSETVRPPLPLTPSSSGASCENSHNNHGHIDRKRKVSSARDRLEKKLKIRKSSMR
uniref:PHD-type domain-containing protein n=1 Tax=Hyaloperonospora arabidopsidis (strain Emoy2) TaxID=559515 RepID=M4BT00_HYAAE